LEVKECGYSRVCWGKVKKKREKTSGKGGGRGLLPKRMEVGPRGVRISS